jgi:hypothetical protein
MSSAVRSRKTTGQWLIPAIFFVVYIGILAVFAVQTYLLVDWLFPAQNFFMKVITVFTFDGIALLCAAAEAFYSFRRRSAHQIVRVAWGVSFIGSCLCTGVWMILSASTKLDFVVPYWIIVLAYVIVTLVFILDIVLGTFAAMAEWRATHPLLDYDDEENLTLPPRQVSSSLSLPEPNDDKLDADIIVQNGNGKKKTLKP